MAPPNLAGRILVVDDDPSLRAFLTELFELEGYEARVVGDGREALEILNTWTPDLIVLDLMMPGIDGAMFRGMLRERPDTRDVPVVVISASRRLEERRPDLEPATIIAKPFDIETLIDAIEHLCPEKRAGSTI